MTGTTTVVAATDVGTNGKFIEPVTLPSTATYTVKVDPQGANTGGITLGLANFAGDTSGTITANGSATVVTSTARRPERDADLLGLREPAHRSQRGGQLRHGVLRRQGVGQVAHRARRSWPRRCGTNGAFVEPVTLTAAGTYTVKVDPDGANTGNVTLNLYTVPNARLAAITAGGAGVAVGDEHRPGPEHEAHVHGRVEPRRSASR